MSAKIFVIDTKSMSVTGVIPVGHKMLEKLEDRQMVVSEVSGLGLLTGPELATLYNQYAASPIKKFDTKAKGIERVWKLLNSEDVSFTVITPAEEVKVQAQVKPIAEQASIGVPGVKKLRKQRDSKFQRLITMLKTGAAFTLKQLAEQSGFTENSVIVRISVLRSDIHEWKMNIVKHKENDTWQLYNQDGTLYHVKHSHKASVRQAA